jgi:acyl-CoA thioester hydrolase
VSAHETPLRVRFAECDPQGIVFNAHYLTYVDVANTELWRDACGSYQAIVEQGLDAVVAEAKLTFRAPACFDDELVLRTAVERLGSTSMLTRCEVTREGEVLVVAELRYVFLSTETWRPTPIPDWVRSRLEPYSGAGAPT